MPQIEREFGSLYYRSKGSGSETVVLLHDFFGTHHSWDYQVLQLARYFRVLAPDLRGHGKSVLERGTMSIDEMAMDIIAMLDEVGASQAYVAGCSHGAVVALHMALNTPDRIGSIVATSVPDLAVSEVIEYGRKYVTTIFPKLEPRLQHLHGRNGQDYSRDVLLRKFAESLDTPPSDHLEALRRANEITVPALVLGGDVDPVMPPDRALHLARSIPDSELGILPHTGHLAHRESPALYTEAILDHFWRSRAKKSLAST